MHKTIQCDFINFPCSLWPQVKAVHYEKVVKHPVSIKYFHMEPPGNRLMSTFNVIYLYPFKKILQDRRWNADKPSATLDP